MVCLTRNNPIDDVIIGVVDSAVILSGYQYDTVIELFLSQYGDIVPVKLLTGFGMDKVLEDDANASLLLEIHSYLSSIVAFTVLGESSVKECLLKMCKENMSTIIDDIFIPDDTGIEMLGNPDVEELTKAWGLNITLYFIAIWVQMKVRTKTNIETEKESKG